jgi:hypothetical protein
MNETLILYEKELISPEEYQRLTEGLAYKRHGLSEKFPPMRRSEFYRLKASLKRSVEEGEINDENPLVITVYGEDDPQILEGWNRYVAVQSLAKEDVQVPTEFKEFTGSEDQALRLVIRENLTRRHLSAEEKVRIAMDLDGLGGLQEEEQPSTDETAPPKVGKKQRAKGSKAQRIAKAAGVSSRTVERVQRKIKKATGKKKSVPEKDLDEARSKIQEMLGEEDYAAILAKQDNKEIMKISQLDYDELLGIASYLAQGLTVQAARHAAPKELTVSHTVKQFIQRAIANGGTLSVVFPANEELPSYELTLNEVVPAIV